jgi:SET domain-containing protein
MGMFWYICHAEQPNCVYTNLEEYVARRNIKAGEELSVDYREWDKKAHHVGDVKYKTKSV